MGRYAGTVASHDIYLAQVTGAMEPRPDTREVQDAIWWDMKRHLRVQAQVSAILATVVDSIEKLRTDEGCVHGDEG